MKQALRTSAPHAEDLFWRKVLPRIPIVWIRQLSHVKYLHRVVSEIKVSRAARLAAAVQAPRTSPCISTRGCWRMRLTNSDEPVRRALNKTRRSGGLSAEQAAASSGINLQKNAQPTITAPALVFTAKSKHMVVVFVVMYKNHLLTRGRVHECLPTKRRMSRVRAHNRFEPGAPRSEASSQGPWLQMQPRGGLHASGCRIAPQRG